jgi:hypothetical protein
LDERTALGELANQRKLGNDLGKGETQVLIWGLIAVGLAAFLTFAWVTR